MRTSLGSDKCANNDFDKSLPNMINHIRQSQRSMQLKSSSLGSKDTVLGFSACLES